jgi:hypothetical protein
MEDGLALGLVLHGATPAQIPQRLAIYERVRRNRAASIQILSHFGYDEAVPDELVDFMEGQPVPSMYLPLLYLPCVSLRSALAMDGVKGRFIDGWNGGGIVIK